MRESHRDRGLSARWWLARSAVIGALLFAPLASGADGPPAGVSNDEWAGIQSQIEVERHKITESDRPGRLYRADNPAQRFTAHFGAEDVLIAPRGRGEPSWQLGLRLTAWGAAHHLHQVEFATAIAEGNRVEYRRGPLTEWYVNTAMGLEQGFTIEAPPGDGIDELVLEMTIEGDLTAELAESGQAVSFHREGSNATLTYSGLKVWDAVEEPLEAWMELTGEGSHLRLVFSVEDPAWPLTVDPVFSFEQKIPSPLDPDPFSGDFGFNVDLDGDWMVVGRLGDKGFGTVGAHIYQSDGGDPTGWEHVVEIEPDDHGADWEHVSVAMSGDIVIIGVPDSGTYGKAYVFQRDHGGPDAWGQVSTIEADTDRAYHFGYSVALDGGTAIIGASRADSVEGAAYVYEQSPAGSGDWELLKKIPNPDPAAGGFFGSSASLDGDTAVIGTNHGSAHVFYRDQNGADSWGHVATTSQDGDAVTVSGDVAVIGDVSFGSGGGAHVFERNHGGPNAWGHLISITGNDTDGRDQFGICVAVDTDVIVVGAAAEDSAGENSGAAYIFLRDHGGVDSWGQAAKITALDASDYDNFGWSATVSGDTVVVGSMQYRFDDYEYYGSVYVFGRDQGGADAWGQAAKIPSPPFHSAWFNHFGTSVDMEGDAAFVGAPKGQGRGWVHIYRQAPDGSGKWERLTRITADDDESPWGDYFGYSTAVSGDTLVVGAYGDNKYDPTSTYWDTGSAYIFQRDQGGPDNWGVVTRIYRHTFRFFGYSVAIDGDTVIVGGEGDPYYGIPPAHIFQRDHTGPNAWGHVAELIPSDAETSYYPVRRVAISGDIAVLSWFNNGAVYMFEREHGGMSNWGETAKFETECYVGGVAIDDDTLVIGALDGSDSGSGGGAAFIFQRDHGGPNVWGQVATIIPHDSSLHDGFGVSVSIDGDTVVVGKSSSGEIGTVYSFHRNHGGPDNWGETGKFSGFDTYSQFGTSVSVTDGMAIVGAYVDSEAGIEAGAAYIFTIGTPLFFDGFESGDTSPWSGTVP